MLGRILLNQWSLVKYSIPLSLPYWPHRLGYHQYMVLTGHLCEEGSLLLLGKSKQMPDFLEWYLWLSSLQPKEVIASNRSDIMDWNSVTWPTTEKCPGLKGTFHKLLKELPSWSAFIFCRFTNKSHLKHFRSIKSWFAESTNCFFKNTNSYECKSAENLPPAHSVSPLPDVEWECALFL